MSSFVHVRNVSVRETMDQIQSSDTADANQSIVDVFSGLLDKVYAIPTEPRQRNYRDPYGPIFSADDLVPYTAAIRENSPFVDDNSIEGLANHVAWLNRVVPASLKATILSLSEEKRRDLQVVRLGRLKPNDFESLIG